MDINLLRERDNVATFTVSELNGYIKNLLDSNRTLSSVTVKGEISNFTLHRSGHLYFSLKDGDSQLKAVMFRSSAVRLKFMPETGMKVIAHGSVTAYVRDGSYQLYVSSLQPDGIGALYLAYEQLKEKLYAEGLFDESHKKPIPMYPSRIGVVTSPTGAAVRDILNVTKRRYPLADIFVYPALVQGQSAAESVRRGVEYLDASGLCDVMIVGRGGGSIEDLWGFNDEMLARAVYAAKTPIISAVGHETDFTICDFVADMRAPTPSAAAEIAVPDIREILMRLDSTEQRCSAALRRALALEKDRLEKLGIHEMRGKMLEFIEELREKTASLYSDAVSGIGRTVSDKRNLLALNSEKCSVLSPLSVLTRGYSIVESNGAVVASAKKLAIGDKLTLRMSDGRVRAEVLEVETDLKGL